MGANSSKVTSQDKAILDMKLQRDKLHQYQKRITLLTAKETQIAKQALATNNKRLALLALRRKKYQETLLSRTDSQLAELEALVANVEFALIQKDVLFGLAQGTKVLKEIHKEMGGLEGVERILGEGREAREMQREVEDMIGGQLSVAEEEEVEDELAALEAEMTGTNTGKKEEEVETATIKVPRMPEVPVGKVPERAPEAEAEAQQAERRIVMLA